jgi:hypothetical protein
MAKSVYRRIAAGGLDAVDTVNRGQIASSDRIANSVVQEMEARR